MSDGFYFWYTDRQDRDGVEGVLHLLETHGAQLAHPVSQVITTITDGPVSWGEQVPVGRHELVELLTLTNRGEVNFQLWLNDQTDVFTRFRRLADGRLVVEFGLDGMTSAEQELAVRAVSQVVDADRQSTWGVIVDRRGLTEDTDWDGLMLGRPVEVAVWPDALGVRPGVAARHPQLALAQAIPEPPLVVFGAGSSG